MYEFDKHFWSNKKVLITGHTGFKGSWLSLWLDSLGAEIFGYALNPPTEPNLFTLAKVAEKIQSRIGDVRDQSELQAFIEQSDPDIIFHLAAQPLVLESYENPSETYEVNVMGTVNVLESLRKLSKKKPRALINVTSDKCYENKELDRGYNENDQLGGHDPYSSSKACAELVTAAFRDSFFDPTKFSTHQIAVASARAGNVIGGGDWAAHRLVPDYYRAAFSSKVLEVRNPSATRPWQHVLDPLLGYILLAQKLYQNPAKFASAWNFGPDQNENRSVKWLLDFLKGSSKSKVQIQINEEKTPHEARLLALDCTKSSEQLGWVPNWSAGDALAQTDRWYQGFKDNENLFELSMHQIKEYEQCLRKT